MTTENATITCAAGTFEITPDNRAIVADALQDEGREAEAAILRNKHNQFHVDNGVVVAGVFYGTEDTLQDRLDNDRDNQLIRYQLYQLFKRNNDPRADGMLWLSLMEKYPTCGDNSWYPYRISPEANCAPNYIPARLLLEAGAKHTGESYPTRREAENAICYAFARLPAELQAELMREAHGLTPQPR
jgi:hypothetical protein